VSTGGSFYQDQSFATLRRFVRRFNGRRAEGEACELCAAALREAHEHLLDVPRGKLVCACGSCVSLFARREDATYRRVPRRVRLLREFQLTDAQWTALAAPIGIAFFFHSTRRQKVAAVLPRPSGASEARLPPETWRAIVAANPMLRDMTPDVEALLVNRLAPPVAYLVPIDECHRLVSLMRAQRREAVWMQLDQFFEDLRHRATVA
jgi:hypothetical protein